MEGVLIGIIIGLFVGIFLGALISPDTVNNIGKIKKNDGEVEVIQTQKKRKGLLNRIFKKKKND